MSHCEHPDASPKDDIPLAIPAEWPWQINTECDSILTLDIRQWVRSYDQQPLRFPSPAEIPDGDLWTRLSALLWQLLASQPWSVPCDEWPEVHGDFSPEVHYFATVDEPPIYIEAIHHPRGSRRTPLQSARAWWAREYISVIRSLWITHTVLIAAAWEDPNSIDPIARLLDAPSADLVLESLLFIGNFSDIRVSTANAGQAVKLKVESYLRR